MNKIKNKSFIAVLFILLSLSLFAKNDDKFSMGKIILDDYPKIIIEIDGSGSKTIDNFYETDKRGREREYYSDQSLKNKEDLEYISQLKLSSGSEVKVYFSIKNGSGKNSSTTYIQTEYTIPKTIVEEPEIPEIPDVEETPIVPEPEIPSTPVITNRTIKINSKISNQSRSRESIINMTKTDDKEDFDIESVQDTSSE